VTIVNLTKWVLCGTLVTSLFAAEGCRRRNRDDDNNNSTNNGPANNGPVANNPPPQQPGIPPQQPGIPPQQPGYPQQQPGIPPQQPGIPQQQPGIPPQVGQEPGMQQPGIPPQPGQEPGMQQPGIPPQPGVGGDYIQAQMQMRQQQFAQGMAAVLPLSRGTLQEHGTQSYAVQMTPGQCYKIIGVGGPGVIDLDLKLYDPSNQVIDEDVATDNYPVIGLRQDHPLCPQTAGQYRLEVVMYQGQGDFGVQVFGR